MTHSFIPQPVRKAFCAYAAMPLGFSHDLCTFWNVSLPSAVDINLLDTLPAIVGSLIYCDFSEEAHFASFLYIKLKFSILR